MPFKVPDKRDLFIIGGLIGLSAVLWVCSIAFNSSGKLYAEIIYNGQVVEKAALNKERKFSIKELPNVVFEVKDNKISFIQSDCPDKVCVDTGWLGRGGQTAACLPNKVIVRVIGGGSDTVDAITR